MSLETKVRELNTLIEQRQLLQGIETFYADDVVMAENGSETAGKEANRERETVFVEGLTKWDAQLLASAVDEERGVALNHWQLTFHHQQWGDASFRQVAVQQWRDGRIVRETFYKNN